MNYKELFNAIQGKAGEIEVFLLLRSKIVKKLKNNSVYNLKNIK